MGAKHGTWAVEIKSGTVAKAAKGFTIALEDIARRKAFVLHGGTDRYPKSQDIEAISLQELMQEVGALS